ncbi:MAG: DUF3429 domain-containing protein [Rhodoferax sp.]|nr:DUF3429 domain-containing protein [Rhodoferax sp.]MBP7492963.1 DUF3429 domain-containing protein [Rhodoferax sp.]
MTPITASSLPLTPWAARLGYAGLLPFVSLAAAAWLAPAVYRAHAAFALLAYGATIASFLGAIHWGLAMRGPLAPRPGPLVWGVFPSLVAWLALLLPVSQGLFTIALLLVICLVVDRGSYPVYGLSDWLPMRWRLTGVAVLSLIAGSGAL